MTRARDDHPPKDRRWTPDDRRWTPDEREAFEHSVRGSRRHLTLDIGRETDKALKRRCPTCDAEPGQPCPTADGTPHATRAAP